MKNFIFSILKGRNILANNSFLFTIDRILISAVNFLAFTIVARVYGPEELGRWSYAVAAIAIFSPLFASGAEPAVVRRLISAETPHGQLLGSAATMIGLTTLVGSALSLLWLAIAAPTDHVTFLLASVLIFGNIASFLVVTEYVLKAEMKIAPIVGVHLITASAGGLLRIIFALNHTPLWWIGAAVALEACLAGFGMLLTYRRLNRLAPRWSFDFRVAIALARDCAPFMGSAVLVALFFRVNYTMLGRYADLNEVGLFASAFTIVQFLGIIPNAITTALYPMLLKHFIEDEYKFNIRTSWLIYGCTLLGYMAFAAGCCISIFLPFLFGAPYSAAIPILMVMSMSLIFTSAGAARAVFVNVIHRPSVHAYSAMAGLFALYLAGLILIPRWGALGAAWAWCFGTFVSCYATTPFFRQMRPIWGTQIGSLLLIPPIQLKGVRN